MNACDIMTKEMVSVSPDTSVADLAPDGGEADQWCPHFGPLRQPGRRIWSDDGIYNFSPVSSVRFDLDGNSIEIFDRAYRIGEIQLSIGGQAVSHAELAPIFSGKYAT
jgi:hypothetical protein